jgi:predicted RNA binding protein YcfA (HicA-like mRNA interferase family)
MGEWPSSRASSVLAALIRIGWRMKRRSGGSHVLLAPDGWTDFVWSFHERDEIGPRMLASVAKHAGLTPRDL